MLNMKIINRLTIGLIIFLVLCMIIDKESQDRKLVQSNVSSYLNNTSSISQIDNSESNKHFENEEEYYAILEIPKLNLKRGIYNYESKLNNVDKNITLLAPTKINDVGKDIIVLAAHSGSSKISFFHNLDNLNLYDSIYFYYAGWKYEFKVIAKYEIAKDGTLEITKEEAILYLTTCSEQSKIKQLVIESKLESSSKY